MLQQAQANARRLLEDLLRQQSQIDDASAKIALDEAIAAAREALVALQPQD